MNDRDPVANGREWVAIVLAVGLAVSLVIMVSAVFYDALRSDTPGLSENATQILTGWGGGVVGVLGGYIGGRAVERSRDRASHDVEKPEPPQPTP